jgi:hypothetical protein
LSTQAASTLTGNSTTSTASPTAFAISSLTSKASPASTDLLLLQDQAASGQLKSVQVSALASAGSVSSVNGATGAIISSLFTIQNTSLTASASAGALTIALADCTGATPSAGSPSEVNFRNVTATTGSYTNVATSAALSLVVPSGATLGVSSNTAFRLWVVLFNTQELQL